MSAEHSLSSPVVPSLIVHDAGLPGLIACWLEARRCDGLAPSSAAGHAGDADWAHAAPVAWFPAAVEPPPSAGEDDEPRRVLTALRRRTLESHQRLCPLAGLSDESAWAVKPAPSADEPRGCRLAGVQESLMLLAALTEAARLGRRRVVWPVCAGEPRHDAPALSAIADACDRAMLAAQLVAIDLTHDADQPGDRADSGGVGGIDIDTPFIDLTDDEVVELGVDAGVPMNMAWWCTSPARSTDAQGGGGGAIQCGSCADCRRWLGAIERVCGRSLLAEPKHPPVTITSAAHDLLERDRRK